MVERPPDLRALVATMKGTVARWNGPKIIPVSVTDTKHSTSNRRSAPRNCRVG